MKTLIRKNNYLTTHYRNRIKKIGKEWKILFFLLSWVAIFSAYATAQGWYWGSPVAPGYDQNSVVEINCVILNVDIKSQTGPSKLKVVSGTETLTVTLGPEWYLRRMNADFKPGDKLNVKGSKMRTQDGKAYLSAAIIKNLRTEKILELRDENGRPLWSSKRRLNKKGQ